MGPDGDRGVGFAHMERTTINNIMQKSLATKAGCRRWRTRPIDEAGDTLGLGGQLRMQEHPAPRHNQEADITRPRPRWRKNGGGPNNARSNGS